MDFVRQKVGGNKARYKVGGYNLDLTYITDRLIAMAYPASGIQKLFRNSIDEVSKVLQENHKENYIVINLSGRNYDQTKLKNVYKYDWQDHKAPPFQTLFQICQKILAFLSEDINRVAVIHCNHGKGRTGTIISCFLMYVGFISDPTDALQYYENKRFVEGNQGVSQPCQINYVRYFGEFLKNTKLKPQIVCLKQVKFHGEYKLSDPYLKIKTIKGDILLNSKTGGNVTLIQQQKEKQLIFKIGDDVPLIGDIVMEIKNNNTLGNNYIGSYTFNTLFIPQKFVYHLPITQLSPQDLIEKDFFGVNFQLQMLFKPYCSCANLTPLKFRCQKCYKLYAIQEKKIDLILKTLQLREQMKQITCHELLFGKKKQNEDLAQKRSSISTA